MTDYSQDLVNLFFTHDLPGCGKEGESVDKLIRLSFLLVFFEELLLVVSASASVSVCTSAGATRAFPHAILLATFFLQLV